jgi:hypothetical protein
MTLPRTVADVLAEHVTFEVECIDRMYLNVYVPQLCGTVVATATRVHCRQAPGGRDKPASATPRAAALASAILAPASDCAGTASPPDAGAGPHDNRRSHVPMWRLTLSGHRLEGRPQAH